MLYTMVFGKLPFSEGSSHATTQAIISGKFNFPKAMVSIEIQDLISQLLTVNPKERPSIYDIQSHPWMLGKIDSTNTI